MKRLITLSAVLLCSLLTTFAQHKVPTDLNALDNAIYIEPVVASSGSQQVLSVRMKNAVAVSGFEFVLQLPQGVSVATDEDEFPLAELSTARTTTKRTSYFGSSLQDDGMLKVLCGTSSKDPSTGLPYAFSGSDGEVARITVDVASDVSSGQYAIVVKNAILASPNAVKTVIESDVESLLEVDGLLPGDANDDGNVTIADAVAVVNYILGNHSGIFVFDAANMDGDSEITISDAFAIVNIILNQ